jgi:hypothetical protein
VASFAFAGDATLELGTPTDFLTPIAAFGPGRTIELQATTVTGLGYAGNTLMVQDGTSTVATLLVGVGYSLQDFGFASVAGGTDITSDHFACYAAGTRILTARGDVAVEHLREGEPAVTKSGETAPIRWIGHRRIDCRRHPRPHDVWPVRVLADAFGSGLPRRDLWLSPDHAVFVDGVLIPIRYLLNGKTVAQEQRNAITYWHVELPRHDLLLAEGLPAESFLDTGNRAAFSNGGASVQLHPEFALRVWETKACAPLVLGGPRLATAKRHFLTQAIALGHRMGDDPGLKILADGRELQADADGRQWRVRLPAGTKTVRLTSRVWSPARMRPDEDDTRLLGVAISRLWLDRREMSFESAGLSSGWHAPEPGWRWTGGDAKLVLPGMRELAFEVAMTGSYWLDEEGGERRAA